VDPDALGKLRLQFLCPKRSGVVLDGLEKLRLLFLFPKRSGVRLDDPENIRRRFSKINQKEK
jgi:hypothetical protein